MRRGYVERATARHREILISWYRFSARGEQQESNNALNQNNKLIRFLDPDPRSELTKLKPLTVKMKTYGEQTVHKLAKLNIMILQKMSKKLRLNLCLPSILLQHRYTGKNWTVRIRQTA